MLRQEGVKISWLAGDESSDRKKGRCVDSNTERPVTIGGSVDRNMETSMTIEEWQLQNEERISTIGK